MAAHFWATSDGMFIAEAMGFLKISSNEGKSSRGIEDEGVGVLDWTLGIDHFRLFPKFPTLIAADKSFVGWFTERQLAREAFSYFVMNNPKSWVDLDIKGDVGVEVPNQATD